MPPRAFHSPSSADSPRAFSIADAAGLKRRASPGPPTNDSETRKKRDARIRSMDEQIAEALEQARQSGELQSAQSWGKPMAETTGYAETPAELRLAFKILKNADAPPPEVALFRQRAELRAQMASCPPGPEQRALQQRLAELEQVLALRLEHLRATGSL